MKVLVTGGCGYIGSHTIVDLIENQFEVICLDDNSRSNTELLHGVAEITGQKVPHYKVDLCDHESLKKVFTEHPDIKGIIHFAAYKYVPESVREPLSYYRNNIVGLLNLLDCVQEHQTPYFVFSSSCSVYGNATALPVTEQSPLQKAESPYANTKVVCEDIINDFAKTDNNTQNILLRYFNPVGAHPSALIGELPFGPPENLVPIITQTACGKRKELIVYGGDYDTRDGTCIRDYIHVMDIANAHTRALQHLAKADNDTKVDVLNLGSGNGVTVLELIKAFEKVSGQSLNYQIGDRRAGDVIQIFANNQKAQEKLGWKTKYNIEDMMSTAWNWQQKLNVE